VKETLKYYGLILPCYLIELYLFNFFQFLALIEPEILNFFIRLIMVILTATIIKIFVFQDRKNFFQLFFFLSLVNPFISSASLLFLYEFLDINIIAAKITGDIFTSLLLFFVLKRVLSN